MAIPEIIAFLQPALERVSALIDGALRSDIGLLDATNRQLREHPGKMMRPILSLLAGGAAGKVNADTERFAAAVELLHNATLLHDDVLDQSASRRGVPTVMSLLGSKASVLAGDFWLVKAVETILDCRRHSKELLRMFSGTVSDLVEGEMLQMEKAGKADTSLMDYHDIIFLKTASLFKTICSAAALTAGASSRIENALMNFGIQLGMAFQIKDDILDYDGDALGKPVGTDLREGKITLPLLKALEKQEPSKQASIRRMVYEIPQKDGNVAKVADFVKENDGTALAAVTLQEYVQRAKECLGPLPESQAKDWLMKLADYCEYRTI